jgi:hypothetical protein
MHTKAPMTQHFEETAIGAVVLLSIMFLSPILLIGGLALIGLTKLVSHWWIRNA